MCDNPATVMEIAKSFVNKTHAYIANISVLFVCKSDVFLNPLTHP